MKLQIKLAKMEITTTKNKAIKLAKEILRNKLNCQRLPYVSIKSTSCRCACGESEAITINACINVKKDLKNWIDVTVGICKHCSNN